MQKYKLKQDSCAQNKSTKHQIASISSNKSLLKQVPTNQNKSTLSVLNSSDINHNKSLNQRNKSSKHLESHTFTNNTHQNSVNVPVNSNSHNNSKSNKKCQNQKKKSTGKKLTSLNTQSKLLAETTHGRTSSQYQNLSTQANNKIQPSKNYKNILKNRKEVKESQPLNQHKQQVHGSKSQKDLKNQVHQKSINVSSFKNLKKKTSKSRSKSKQFKDMNKKSNPSKKHLLTEPSFINSKQNNMNQINQKKCQVAKKSEKLTKSHPKQKGIIIQNFESKKIIQKKIIEIDAEQYEKVPFYMLKSSTNSDIQFSNADENTVKQLIKQQKISNKAYFYEGQFQDVVFLKDNYNGQQQGDRFFKKQSDKLSKRYSKMNLQLSSQCLNCLTEPDYAIEPKGIRHKYANILTNEQQIRSSKQTSQFSSKPEKSISKKQLINFRHGKSSISQQLLNKSAVVIQKVWRGYMTRKLLQRYINEQEMRLCQRMRQIDLMKRQKMQRLPEHQEEKAQQLQRESFENQNDSDEEAIKIQDDQQIDESDDKADDGSKYNINQHTMSNNSVNPLDYESQILHRDEAETISFIVELNNIASKHVNNIHSAISIKQSVEEVLYTSVESIEHLSKVENIYGESQGIVMGHDYSESQFLKDDDKQSQEQEQDNHQIDDQQHQQSNSPSGHGYDESQIYQEKDKQFPLDQQKQNQFKANFFKQQQEEIKKYNFFNNNTDQLQQKEQHSQSYQQSSYNQPSSIFFRPSQQQYPQDSYLSNKLSDKDQTNSYFINQSLEQHQSIPNTSNNKKSSQLQESSYCIPDQTDINQSNKYEVQNQSYQKNLQKIKENHQNQTSNLNSDFLQQNSEPLYQQGLNNQFLKQINSNSSKNYQIDYQASKLEQQYTQKVEQKNQSENKQKLSLDLEFQYQIPNKSNPNIFLLKSPKNHSLSKSYFSHSKSSKKSNQKQFNNQNIKKTSSLKQFFFKKSLVGNEILSDNQQIEFPINSFSSYQLNLLAFPTQKQASSIESLLHFRHQCLTHQHSAQFKEIQELYVKQKISKQDFIVRLQKLACNFESSAVSIKQAQKDIFNGYKALLKLIKDVLKDCKILGLNQEKGSNVRFCRSMEIFFREKDKISNQKCIFDDEYLWRFDEIMIDQMDKSKHRVLSHSKTAKNQEQNEQIKEEKIKVYQEEEIFFSKDQTSKDKKNEAFAQNSIKKVETSPVVEEKQLSRQSLSHHQLPQLILQNKSEKQNSSLKSSSKITPNKDENNSVIGKQVFEKPCNFDISELGSCDDDYFDEDEESSEQKKNLILISKGENEQTFRQNQRPSKEQNFDDSNSYDIDEDSLMNGKQQYSQKINEEEQDQQIKIDGFQNSSDQEQDKRAFKQVNTQNQVTDHQKWAISVSQSEQINQYEALRTTQLKSTSDIHLVINDRNKEFLEKQHDDQDLLDQEDDNQIIPVIKRQVYQLSCDSDQEDQFQDKWDIKDEENHFDLIYGEEKKIHSSKFYQKNQSVSLYDQHDAQQKSQLSKKYASLAEITQQVLIWEFIQEIVLNKNKSQSKTSFGKKIAQIAKNHLLNDSYFNFSKNEDCFGQNNIVIISNEKCFKRTKKINLKDQNEKSLDYTNRESTSKITNQEINGFLRTLYQEFPTFDENKSKLTQRMYPSPLQLLRSLRDTSMEDYFYDQQERKNRKSGSNSSQSRKNDNDQQSELSQKQYSDNSNVDSETSYLELGSYEFLLSQQLCESLIEKYITQVYDIEMDKKTRAEREGNTKIQTVKKQFNEYIAMKSIMISGNAYKQYDVNALLPSRLPKQGSFQSVVRTRQLFLQHKDIQSQMLRKQILKIELHTILDSMNQELIKQREAKSGYSGIGLSEFALGMVQRTGIQVATEEDYDVLVKKAKYRLQKFVLNEEVNLNDKLLLQCQQSVTINDSQWIFYVTQALEFGLEIAKIVEEYLWEQTVREISKIQMKRKFRLDDSWILQKDKLKLNQIREIQSKKDNLKEEILQKEENHSKQEKPKGKRVISINIVDSSQKQQQPVINIQQNVQTIEFYQTNLPNSMPSEEQNEQSSLSSSYVQQNSQDIQQEEVDFPLLKRQEGQNEIQDIQIIETVRKQTLQVIELNQASNSPIQHEGHLCTMNDSTSNFTYQFNHQSTQNQQKNTFHTIEQQNFQSQSGQQQQFNQSSMSMPKLNDQSKSFEDQHIQNQHGQFYQNQQQINNQITNNNQRSQQQNCTFQVQEQDSYQLDGSSMQFDQQLDKQLDQMNNY